ncbi:uncharacterized protein KIAA2013 homolog [Pecten maximus]|uniref:uncharacterized protein KIAA2013 homolog n=1 Tax=Pecten maximus TaxID=6579 RepID=UPI00145867EF|nr:uncharacterized protein KIAA2013 homolog [Pecten maximus]
MNNGLIFVRRIFCCKFPIAFRTRQMWWKGSIQNSFSRINSLSRSRKLILLILLLLLLLYFLGPYFFRTQTTQINLDVLDSCVEDKVRYFHKATQSFDAFVNSPGGPTVASRHYPAYVGNGHLAAALGSSNGLFVRLNRALSLPVKFFPVVSAFMENTHSSVKEVTALHIKSGIAYRIQTIHVESGWTGSCVSIGTQLYAHRSRPSVLVQDIKLSNPSKNQVVVDLDQIGDSGWEGSKTILKSAKNNVGEDVQYSLTSGEVSSQLDDGYISYVTVATVKLPEKFIKIPAGKTKLLHVVTVVHYTAPMPKNTRDPVAVFKDLEGKVDKDMLEVLKIDDNVLREEHIHVWNKLWQSGFGISYSKASGALNGDKINSTMYYVMSNIPAPLHSVTSTQKERTEIYRTLHYPDRCYGGHSTLHANTLWVDVSDEDDIARVTTTWMITLEKQGCSVMVKAGAEGVIQAMVLSLGALRFANDHLEFAMEPKDLHRDLFFHRINYGNNTHVNVSVIVGEDNRANIYVALDRNDRPYYACDAGCIDAPAALSKELKQFPVKQTKPLTSILYITADKIHMEELKHAIHVENIVEAPAHEHHVIALHKHGHHFGGLPTIFWVSIAFLVVIFHLFLCKLIYNEYCAGQERFTRGRYNV